MLQKDKVVAYQLSEVYLCPGNESGAHITNSSVMCACGNTNLVSLQRILDRETTVVSMIDILMEEHPEMKIELEQTKEKKVNHA